MPNENLFMLVSIGTDRMQAAYRHTIAPGHRFNRWGDAPLVLLEGTA